MPFCLDQSTVSIHTVYQSFLILVMIHFSSAFAAHLGILQEARSVFLPWAPDAFNLPFASGVVCRSPWSHCLCSFHTISRAASAECNGYCHVGGPFGMTSCRRGEMKISSNTVAENHSHLWQQYPSFLYHSESFWS